MSIPRLWRAGFAALSALVLFVLPAPLSGAQPSAHDPEEVIQRARSQLSRSEYKEVLAALTPLRDRPGLSDAHQAEMHTLLASALVETSNYDPGLRSADTAEALGRQLNDFQILARVELIRGTAARYRGRSLQALEHYRRGLEMTGRTDRKDLQGTLHTMLSSTYQGLGDWSRVLYHAEQAFAARPDPDERARFNYLVQRGIAYFEFHERDEAARSFEQALALAEKMNDRRAASFALGELGMVAWTFDRDESRALEYYDRALALARAVSVPVLESTWLLNSGGVFRDSGDFAEALRRYRLGLEIERKTGQDRNVALLLKNTGQVLSSLGRAREAETVLLEALSAADREGRPHARWQARMELGRLYSPTDPAKADRFFNESLSILEEQHANVLLENFRTGALERSLEQYDPYDLYVDFLMAQGRVDAAFHVAERARARAFLATLRAAREHLADAVPAWFVEAENALLQRISTAQTKLRTGDLDTPAYDAILQSIEADEDDLRTLRLRLSIEQPALAEVRFPRLWAAPDLRAQVLEAGEVLLMFFVGRRRSVAWVVTRTGVEAVALPDRRTLDEAVREHLTTIDTPASGGTDAQPTRLSRLLLRDIAGRLRPGSRLIVVPHGILHYLPFETLTGPDGQYLVRNHVISYAPSASSFAYLRQLAVPAGREGEVVLVGNPALNGVGPGEAGFAHGARGGPQRSGLEGLRPLPHSRDELRRIAGLFPSVTVVLDGERATEAALDGRRLDRSRILHFATHGVIDEERPERSGLALTARPPGSDGFLQMREVYRLRLSGTLVTLSACETALGRNVVGEGLIGLTRAFFYAGASSVVASLWNVNDASTARLMMQFYGRIRSGQPIDRALQEAKLAFLDGDPRFRHPYYWAPFIVLGHATRTVEVPRPAVWPRLAFGAAAVILLAGYLTVRRRTRRKT